MTRKKVDPSYPKSYKTRGGIVTVLEFSRFRLNGARCYRVVLAGEADRFFGADANIIAHRYEADGTAIVAYIPDDKFDEYAESLDRLGHWPANSEVL